MPNIKLPTIGVISTGGTLTTLSGIGELDLFEYTATGTRLNADEMLAKFPQAHTVADIVPIKFDTLPSTAVSFPHWKKLVLMIESFLNTNPSPSGVVILDGTATLEETAYALSLTLRTDLPVVLTGAQRPASALSPDFGALGHADGDRITFYRKPLRHHNPHTEFDLNIVAELPRVEIAYHYAGSDGTATRAFIQAGAKGIVGAAFAPGLLSPQEDLARKEAVAAGVKVVISSRAGSGRTFGPSKIVDAGFIRAAQSPGGRIPTKTGFDARRSHHG